MLAGAFIVLGMSLATAAHAAPRASTRTDSLHFGVGTRRTASALPNMLAKSSNVVALRRRRVIAMGALGARGEIASAAADGLLVTARTPDGAEWWMSADAVWTDAGTATMPDRPRSVGLATAGTDAAATLLGLSDRLGWEAARHLRKGGELVQLRDAGLAVDLAPGTQVLDGRLGHDVPTVVLLHGQIVRWGAGATRDAAIQRALHGSSAPSTADDARSELAEMTDVLARSGLSVASVDLGSKVLRSAGIIRCSVQLLT